MYIIKLSSAKQLLQQFHPYLYLQALGDFSLDRKLLALSVVDPDKVLLGLGTEPAEFRLRHRSMHVRDDRTREIVRRHHAMHRVVPLCCRTSQRRTYHRIVPTLSKRTSPMTPTWTADMLRFSHSLVCSARSLTGSLVRLFVRSSLRRNQRLNTGI